MEIKRSGQAGWGIEQPGLVECVSVHGKGVEWDEPLPTQTTPWFCNLKSSNKPMGKARNTTKIHRAW